VTPILSRIRAHGGDATLDGWSLRIKRGRLTDEALAWLRGRRDDLMREVWPAYDDWQERAAIREFDGGQPREDAEREAYREVMDRHV